MQCNAAGQLVLGLKTPWCDGTTQLVMSQPDLMQRLVGADSIGADISGSFPGFGPGKPTCFNAGKAEVAQPRKQPFNLASPDTVKS
jgi:hypothetical protein